MRLLYWFRTPPNVRVGRAAIDEGAIRWLEEGHPDVTFDWTRILQAEMPPEPHGPAAAGAARRRSKEAERRAQPAARAITLHPPLDRAAELPEAAGDPLASLAATGLAARAVDAADQAAAEPAQDHQTASDAVSGIISHEDVGRLRGRYAEVLARISERVSDPSRADELRLQADVLNPDSWVTPDEVRRGIDAFDRNEQRIRELLGRRRRSRRGGARHRRRKTAAGETGPCGGTGPAEPGTGAGVTPY
ncbi:MAG: hypothetical protein IMZ55_17950 [Acidobacteria bacterium]|nr:hypothetical protein [Acidobacteriota bacterium]